MEKFDAHRYRDNLAEDLKNTEKSERSDLLESEKSTIRYKKAYEIHQEEVKEYAITRIDEKVSDLNAEIDRLNKIKADYLREPLDGNDEIVSEETENILSIEKKLEGSNQECVLDVQASSEDIQNVLSSSTLEEFKQKFNKFIEGLLEENELHKLAFAKKLKPDADKLGHEILRTVVSRIVSGDRPISIGSSQHRDIFKGLGLDIVDFSSKLEHLQTKSKLNYDISDDFFNPDRVVLNEFTDSLDGKDKIDFSLLLSSLHELDNESMSLPEIEECILRIKASEREVLDVVSSATLEEFNDKLSNLISDLLEKNNLSIQLFADKIENDRGLVSNVKRGVRPISVNSEQHKSMFKGLGLDIKMFESRQRKLLGDKKYGIQKLENFKYSDRDIKPYINVLSENFSDLTVGDLVRVAHFIDDNFEMLEKNNNVFIEILSNEFPELKRVNS